MNSRVVLTGLLIVLFPAAIMAGPVTAHKTAKTAATMYECQKCHMKVSAAVAKKDHFKDPMDGGKLVPVAASTKKPGAAKPMGGMSM